MGIDKLYAILSKKYKHIMYDHPVLEGRKQIIVRVKNKEYSIVNKNGSLEYDIAEFCKCDVIELGDNLSGEKILKMLEKLTEGN